jgi:hypothetical protein
VTDVEFILTFFTSPVPFIGSISGPLFKTVGPVLFEDVPSGAGFTFEGVVTLIGRDESFVNPKVWDGGDTELPSEFQIGCGQSLFGLGDLGGIGFIEFIIDGGISRNGFNSGLTFQTPPVSRTSIEIF